MKTKKISQNEEEIDILELLKKWWSFRKLVFFGTIIVGLLSIFAIILSQNLFQNQKQKYITTVLNGDLGQNNIRIISAFKSNEYIKEALNKISIDLSPEDLVAHMNIKYATDPISENLQNRIASLTNKDIKNLALSNDNLKTIMESLKDSSKELITIQLYHIPLNLSVNQAKNLIAELTKIVNKNLLLFTNRENLNLNIIDTKNMEVYLNEAEQISRFTNMINSIQNNLSTIRSNYQDIIFNVDLSALSNFANISQQVLFQLSEKLGSSIAIDTLNVNILSKERDIKDLKESLEYLKSQEVLNINSELNQQNSNTSNTTQTQLDGEVFDKILSIGSKLNLNSFRLETISKIQEIQRERNDLINQKDLLNLPYTFGDEEINLDIIGKRILDLSIIINQAVNQVRSFTQPKNAVTVVKNPELIETNSININKLIKLAVILSLVGFFIISFISILLPSKK